MHALLVGKLRMGKSTLALKLAFLNAKSPVSRRQPLVTMPKVVKYISPLFFVKLFLDGA